MKLSLAVALVASLVAPGCASEIAEDAASSSASDLTSDSEIEVVQFNPYYGGMYDAWRYTQPDPRAGAHTYATMDVFAKLLHEHHPNAAVIGMEEIPDAAVAEEIRTRLGPAWRTKWYGEPGNDGSLSSAMFWRDDLVVVEEDFGQLVVGHTSAAHGSHPMIFGGALLGKRGTTHHFGFFTGKLAPRTWGAESYAAEATHLTVAIAKAMVGHPGASRVLAIDQNDPGGGDAFDTFVKSFSQSGDDTPTWQSPKTQGDAGTWYRFDYIWADWDGGGKQKGRNFVGKNDTMGGAGSDHRAVVSTIRIAP